MTFDDVGPLEILDIVLTAVPVYAVLISLRRARSSLVLGGILIAGIAYLTARLLGLQLLALFLQGFFAVILVALIVMFQEELRQLFEGVALRVLGRRRGADAAESVRPDVATLVRALGDLARDKVGALIVLAGRAPLSRHLQGGIPLDARPSAALIESLFDPHSMGHDGAVVIADGRVHSFSCRLPLSTAPADDLTVRGTRHAAALGLAERTDALCLVVSEERGTISVAQGGKLEPAGDAAGLAERIRAHLDAVEPAAETRRRSWSDGLAWKLGALLLSVAMWFFLVHEASIEYRTYTVPVRVTDPDGYAAVERLNPDTVRVVVSAPRRGFYFVRADEIEVMLPLHASDAGEHLLRVTASDVKLPEPLIFESVVPQTVHATLAAP